MAVITASPFGHRSDVPPEDVGGAEICPAASECPSVLDSGTLAPVTADDPSLIEVARENSISASPRLLSSRSPPISIFPAEILAIVFDKLNQEVHGCMSLERTDITLLVTQVCSFWRQVAIGTPELWSGAVIYVPEESAKASRLAGFARYCLSRSGALPLSIWFLLEKQQPITDGALDCLKVLAEFLPRCETLEIAFPASWFQHLPDTPLPYLTSLRIRSPKPKEFEPQDVKPLTTFCDTLNLQQAELECTSVMAGSVSAVRWSKLTTLRLNWPDSVRACVQILAECHSLEDATLSTKGHIPEQADILPGDQEVLLPKLKSLKLRGHRTGILAGCLRAPLLRSLVVAPKYFAGAGRYVQWSGLLKSAEHLNQLSMLEMRNGWLGTLTDLESFLRAVPSVQVLKVHDYSEGPACFPGLKIWTS
ncbi:hypothetical protein OE88DRAFT_1646040 [Heliocybe sulcata]|uniref:F-box domain-containing protein n=1 Tax=Heliocybe sulcata TaxID=5364 RepID=A0A5C3MVQ1_9AGAM|nr:hypothetical protein OE88DRAFT_1646040 [Heliocybe sulcata]